MIDHVRVAEGYKPNDALLYTVDLHDTGMISLSLYGGMLNTDQARALSDALLRAVAMREPFLQRITQAKLDIATIVNESEDDILDLLNNVDPTVALLCPPPIEDWHGKVNASE